MQKTPKSIRVEIFRCSKALGISGAITSSMYVSTDCAASYRRAFKDALRLDYPSLEYNTRNSLEKYQNRNSRSAGVQIDLFWSCCIDETFFTNKWVAAFFEKFLQHTMEQSIFLVSWDRKKLSGNVRYNVFFSIAFEQNPTDWLGFMSEVGEIFGTVQKN